MPSPKDDMVLGGPAFAMIEAIKASRNCVTEPGKECSPLVGAVVVKDYEILAVAYRGELAPGDHAEIHGPRRQASRRGPYWGDDQYDARTLYRAEPNKTPCVQRIIDRGVSHVVIGTLDPNPDIRGLGELLFRREKVAVTRFIPELMEQVEQLNAKFFEQYPLDSKLKRTASEKADPVEPGELFGPNGNPIGYDGEGNKVEWMPDEENPGEIWAMILRRSDESILKEYKEIWEKVWWNRHMYSEHRHEDELISCEGREGIGCEPAARIEKKYGRENLVVDDVDWGILQGKMSTLSWAMGSEWVGSMDT